LADLFDNQDLEALRQKARECFKRLVGRYSMSPAEKKALREKAEQASIFTTGDQARMSMEARLAEKFPDLAPTKATAHINQEDDIEEDY